MIEEKKKKKGIGGFYAGTGALGAGAYGVGRVAKNMSNRQKVYKEISLLRKGGKVNEAMAVPAAIRGGLRKTLSDTVTKGRLLNAGKYTNKIRRLAVRALSRLF